ncbi:MAG: FAD:protein FMN transferase, partial [Rhodocyclaceae bacterium]|nr:FAD:protein FMN transferase [Rhodocyclaceae bacterium]
MGARGAGRSARGIRGLLGLVAAALLLAGCGREAPYGQESYVFGTRVEVLVWGADPAAARRAVAEVLRDFDY